MNFDVGVHFKMTTKGSRYSSNSDRGHVIAHSERYHENKDIYYKNHNVDSSKSYLNDYYKNPFTNPYRALRERFKDKATEHDLKAIKQDNFQLLYGSYEFKGKGKNRKVVKVFKPAIDGYLKDRWLKPLRTVPFKFCTMKEKSKLLNLCEKHRIDYKHYALAVNQGYRSYVDDFNKNNEFMKITRCDTNLDEPGGDHGHIEYLGLGATSKGKPSLSFNNAVKHTLPSDFKGGYKKAMSAFRSQQSKSLLHHLDKSFQNQGLDIHFNMVSHARDPKTYINDMALYKQTMREVDKNKAQAQEAKREANQSFQRLSGRISSLKGLIRPLLKQNQDLARRVNFLRYENQRLRKLNIDDTDILNGTPSWLEDIQHKQTIESKLRTTYQNRLKNRLDNDNSNLATMISNNSSWNHEWQQSRKQLKVLNGVNQLSPRLQKALIALSNGSDNLLIEYLTDLLESAKKEQESD